jgi:hypothetical protein
MQNMRYVNLHQGQQPMQPQAQMQQAPQIVMTAQGPMMMTAQGWVPVSMQQIQQMQQMQQPQQMMPMMQPGMPQGGMMMPMGMPNGFPQGNQAAVPARFGGSSTGNQAVMAPQQQMVETGGRFGMQQAQQIVNEEETSFAKPYLFEVTPTTNKYLGNDKFKIQTTVEAVKANHIDYNDNLVACNCLKESIENVIEQANAKPTVAPVTVRETISNINFWNVNLKTELNALLGDDVKTLYKSFKLLYADMTDVRNINLMNDLDTVLTNAVNDYLIVNAKEAMEIESFHTDFNDLLKVIRKNDDDLEEMLLDYMNKYISHMHLMMTNTPEVENATHITEHVTIAYVDKPSIQLGIHELGLKFVEVENCLPNTYLISLAAEVIAKISKPEFILATMDRATYKVMVAESSEVYIKRLA